MAEENAAPETDEATSEQAAEQPETGYKALYEQAKAESRKWEGRSKANAKELEALKKQPAKDRTVEDRLAALEKENETLRATAVRNALVDSVAKATGLDKSIVSAQRRRRGRPHRAGAGNRREAQAKGGRMRCSRPKTSHPLFVSGISAKQNAAHGNRFSKHKE